MSFPRYEHYKDSGVEWLGEVPEHWAVGSFKWEIARNDGGVWGVDPDGGNDTIVLRSTEQTVDGFWQLDDPATRKLTTAEKAAALLAAGDLLVTKSSGSSLHIGKTTLVTDEIAAMDCCYSNFMQRLRLRSSFIPKLAWYVMNNDLARVQFDYWSNSTTGLANLNGTMIGQVLLTFPPLPEQHAIAAFLDRETAKIDALIAEQQRLVALLAEKRQAVISHAVTKGLNPDAPMKDSGIEWLGEVPGHWVVSQLRYSIKPGTSITYGIVQAGPHVEDGIPYIKTSDMAGSNLPLDGYSKTSKEIDHSYARSKVYFGDLVIAIRATVGKCLPLPEELSGANLTQGTAKISPDKKILRDYLLAYINSSGVQTYLNSLAKGATFKEITLEMLRKTPVLIPALKEQEEIVKYFYTKVTEFDALSLEAGKAIALLQERRTALISSAVTGKIDVRGSGPSVETAIQ